LTTYAVVRRACLDASFQSGLLRALSRSLASLRCVAHCGNGPGFPHDLWACVRSADTPPHLVTLDTCRFISTWSPKGLLRNSLPLFPSVRELPSLILSDILPDPFRHLVTLGVLPGHNPILASFLSEIPHFEVLFRRGLTMGLSCLTSLQWVLQAWR